MNEINYTFRMNIYNNIRETVCVNDFALPESELHYYTCVNLCFCYILYVIWHYYLKDQTASALQLQNCYVAVRRLELSLVFFLRKWVWYGSSAITLVWVIWSLFHVRLPLSDWNDLFCVSNFISANHLQHGSLISFSKKFVINIAWTPFGFIFSPDQLMLRRIKVSYNSL